MREYCHRCQFNLCCSLISSISRSSGKRLKVHVRLDEKLSRFDFSLSSFCQQTPPSLTPLNYNELKSKFIQCNKEWWEVEHLKRWPFVDPKSEVKQTNKKKEKKRVVCPHRCGPALLCFIGVYHVQYSHRALDISEQLCPQVKRLSCATAWYSLWHTHTRTHAYISPSN